MRITRRRLVLISDRANDVPLPGSRAANTQAVSILYTRSLPRAQGQPQSRQFMSIYLAPPRRTLR